MSDFLTIKNRIYVKFEYYLKFTMVVIDLLSNIMDELTSSAE